MSSIASTRSACTSSVAIPLGGSQPSPGTFDFAAEDAVVDDSRARGLVTIGICVQRAVGCARRQRRTLPDSQKFAAFAEATARHFAGRVDAWGIWNEPNDGSRFWQPREDGAEYARLLAAAYPAVKRGNPAATVLLGGLIYLYEGIVTDAATFLGDAFTYDPDFSAAGSTCSRFIRTRTIPRRRRPRHDGHEQPVGQMVSRTRALLAYYGAPRPIRVTELGWPTYGTVDEAAQGRFDARAAIEAMAAGAERVCLYTLDDGPNPTAFPPEDAFGQFHHDGTPKLAASALQALTSIDSTLAISGFVEDSGVRHYTLTSAAHEVDVSFAADRTSDPVYVINR